MKRIQLAVQKAGPVRTETLMGREYRVFPAILVREQVLNNNLGATFLPADEIKASVDAWNGVPVVLRHPTRRGAPVSARDPEVLNARGAGFLFRARFEDASLKADVFIDPTTGDETTGVVNSVDGGAPGELSTGFGCNVETAAGTFDGQAYDVILRDIQPDHLALLPDEVGACSVEDGCGLGVNHAGPCSCTPALPEPPDAADPAALAGNDRWQRFMGAVAKLFGFRREATNQSDEDRRRMLTDALRATFGGPGKDIWTEAVFSEESEIVFELMSQATGPALMRCSYTVAADGSVSFTDPVPVRRVTVFEPVANEAGQFTQEERIMDRPQMIAHLARTGPLDAEALAKLSDAQLQALCSAGSAAPAPGSGPAPAGAPAQGGDTEAWRIAHDYRQRFEQLEAQTRNAVESEERERARLLDDVLYAQNRPWSDDEVRAMPIGELRKVHAVCCPRRADYSGRGTPRAGNAGGNFDFVRPIMDGHRGESVLDRQEAN